MLPKGRVMQEPLKSPAAVLFDLDGTLLDTADDLGAALNFVLKKYNFLPIEPHVYRPVASDGAKGLLELGFKDKLNQFDYETLRAEFLQYYQENIAVHTCFYDGITDILAKLTQDNIPWGVVTNKPEGLTKLLLPHFKEFKHCAVLVGGDTLKTRKPDPEPLFFACQQIKVTPNQCFYIGDALRDIEAGNHAEMTTVIAQWGYIKASDEISTWQADYISKLPSDMLPLIK